MGFRSGAGSRASKACADAVRRSKASPRGRILALGLSALIRAYQLIVAPILPPSCRFYPSCSHYAAEAVERHGPWRGLVLALRRLLRCHPWGGSGYDPVPPVPSR